MIFSITQRCVRAVYVNIILVAEILKKKILNFSSQSACSIINDIIIMVVFYLNTQYVHHVRLCTRRHV